jgi:hypothetical protein
VRFVSVWCILVVLPACVSEMPSRSESGTYQAVAEEPCWCFDCATWIVGGKLMDPTRAPLASWPIRVESLSRLGNPGRPITDSCLASTETDADGTFALELGVGEQRVESWGEALPVAELRIDYEERELAAEVVLPNGDFESAYLRVTPIDARDPSLGYELRHVSVNGW